MDTERLSILLTAIEKGSLAAAAEHLDYTVSGVSRSISALEQELGFSLLHRSKQGVIPTAECQSLLPSVRELLFAEQKLMQTAAQIRGLETGTIVTGCSYSCYYQSLTRITASFRALHPGIQFHFVSGSSSALYQKLSEHQLDFALASRREGDYAWLPLCDDPHLAILPASHPLANVNVIPMETFVTEPFIATYPDVETDYSLHFKKYHIHPNIQYTTTDLSATYAMVAAGLGLSINNQISAQASYPNVVHIPLDPPQLIPIGIACHRDLPPAARTFYRFLQENLKSQFIPDTATDSPDCH